MSETYSNPNPSYSKGSNESKLLKNLGNITMVAAVVYIVFYCLGYFDPSKKNEAESSKEKTTELQVVNNHPTDTVLVYLTLSTGDHYVDDVNGIFGIKSTNKLQGSFYLNPHDTLSYICPDKKGIDGNISFWTPPLNCPYVGTTLYEFVLNNKGTVINAQETVDISCVAGVTTIGSIEMTNGGNWTDNIHPKPIKKIQNKKLYDNGNISGVFPFGCTNCTNHDGAPDCNGRPAYASPNSQKICTVQRNAKNNGGLVLVAYIEKAP